MCLCIDHCCNENVDLLPTIKNAALCAVAAVSGRPNALSILRNGGWEQTLRNEISFVLEQSGNYFGLTEAVLADIDRIDVLGRCRKCDDSGFGARFAIETKTNFTRQPSQLSDAINKLARLRNHNISKYLIYTLTCLRASQDSDLQKLHNFPEVSRYKAFNIVDPWGDSPIEWNHGHLLTDQRAGEGPLISAANGIGNATARVGIWVAQTNFADPPLTCHIHWINVQGQVSDQTWVCQGRALSRKGKLQPPKWSLQQ